MVHVNKSTLFELTGFGFLDVGAWHVNFLSGAIVSGVIFLFIGYSIDDSKDIGAITAVIKGFKTLNSRFKRAKP